MWWSAKTKKLSGRSRRAKSNANRNRSRVQGAIAAILVRALWEQRHEHHQIGQRKQPLVSLISRRFRCTGDKAQVAVLGEVMQVVDANPGKRRNFRVGEDLLAGFYGNHGLGLFLDSPLLRWVQLHSMLCVSY